MALALTQDQWMAIGFKKQVDLVTALTAADMVTLGGTTMDFNAEPKKQNNATDKGKGVYSTKTFKSHYECGGNWAGIATSQALAIISAFAVGKITKAAAGSGFKYTMVAPDLTADGLDMPVTTIATKTGAVNNKALIGMACEEFGVSLTNATGREGAQFTSSWTGTGKNSKPSGITFPAAYAESEMNAGSLTTLSFIGFDYLASGRMNQFSFSFKNNKRSGFFPGSGSQSGYQLQGRMRRGVPTITVSGRVECDSGSDEESALLADTEGTGVIAIQGPLISGSSYHGWKITLHRIQLEATKLGDADGIAAYDVTYTAMQHSTNGVFTIEATTDIDNILA